MLAEVAGVRRVDGLSVETTVDQDVGFWVWAVDSRQDGRVALVVDVDCERG